MKKIAVLIIFAFVFCGYGFSQSANDVTITVEITNVVVNNGVVYLALFDNAESFRREVPEFAYELPSNSATLTIEITIPAGEYVVSAFQDANGNQQMDTNFLGVPRELVGLSGYTGQGLPSKNFNRQKIPINSTTGRVTVGLYKF